MKFETPVLFAMDLDGTLLDAQDAVHPRDREAIAGAIEAGAIVTIATGRLTSRTHPTARSLGLTAPLICADGAVLACSVTERVLSQRAVALATAEQVVARFVAAGASSFVFLPDTVHCCPRASVHEHISKGWSYSVTIQPDILEACAFGGGPVMLVAMGEAPRIDALRQELAGLGDELDLVSFDIGDTRVLRLMPSGVSKGSALTQLARELGVELERVAVIGDWYNDVSMFEVAPHAYAMPQAPQALREKASHVLDPDAVRRGAIATALEHWYEALAPRPTLF